MRCWCVKTLRTPHELLDRLHEIEQAAHRTREIHWGPRTLDLDILFYDEELLSDDVLTIPHPEIPKRDFVLRPMVQIAPYFVHPVYHKTIMQLWEQLQGIKKAEKHTLLSLFLYRYDVDGYSGSRPSSAASAYSSASDSLA